jgi:hypothetical protein
MADPRPQTEPDELTGLKSLGKRITRRTFDLTAFAIVTVGLITIAVRLSSWWQVNDADVAAAPGINAQSQVPWGLGEEGASLSFGDATWSARHIRMPGTADEVRQRVVADCARRLEDRGDSTSLPESTPEEERLITRLVALSPIAAADDESWKVYALDGPLLAVFGIITEETADAASPVARIACWGLALPAGEALMETESGETENRLPLWSAWMIDPAGSKTGETDHGLTVPYPEGASRMLSIRDPLAGGIDTFQGPGTTREWQEFYAAWLQSQGAEDLTWNSDRHREHAFAVIEHAGQSWRCDVLLSELPEDGEIECVVNLVEMPAE